FGTVTTTSGTRLLHHDHRHRHHAAALVAPLPPHADDEPAKFKHLVRTDLVKVILDIFLDATVNVAVAFSLQPLAGRAAVDAGFMRREVALPLSEDGLVLLAGRDISKAFPAAVRLPGFVHQGVYELGPVAVVDHAHGLVSVVTPWAACLMKTFSPSFIRSCSIFSFSNSVSV